MPMTAPITTFEGIFEPATTNVTATPAPGLAPEGALKVEVVITDLKTNAGDFTQLCADRWKHFRDDEHSIRLEHDNGLKVTYRVICENTPLTQAAIQQIRGDNTLDEIMRLLTVLDLFWD